MKEKIILVVAGGRDYAWTEADTAFLNSLPEPWVVLTGGSGIVDTRAEQWARSKGIQPIIAYALWDYYSKAAGPIRNSVMAQLATHAAIFPGHTGTADMLKKAQEMGLVIHMREGT